MILLNAKITNPFSDRFDVIYNKSGKTWNPNKFWEIDIVKNNIILGFWFSWTTRQDHAGIIFEVSLFGTEVSLRLYDHRHWDDENNCWCVYETSRKD